MRFKLCAVPSQESHRLPNSWRGICSIPNIFLRGPKIVANSPLDEDGEETSNAPPPAVDTAHTTIVWVSGIITWMWCKVGCATDMGSLSHLCPWPCKAPWNSLAQRTYPLQFQSSDGYLWRSLAHISHSTSQCQHVPSPLAPSKFALMFLHLVNDGSRKGPLFSMTNILLSSSSSGLYTLQTSSLWRTPLTVPVKQHQQKASWRPWGTPVLVLAKGWYLTFTEQRAGAMWVLGHLT